MTATFWAAIAAIAVLGHVMALIWHMAERRDSRLCRRKIYEASANAAQTKREARNALHAPTHAVLLLAFGWAGCFAARGAGSFAATLVFAFLWAEVWHYFSHRAFHLDALHWIHAEHHRSRVSGPLTAISFSFTEKLVFDLGFLGVMAVVDRFVSLNFFGVAAWYVGYLVINSFSHANFEFRPASYNSFLGKALASTTYHSLHHARYTGNYGLGTRFLDRLLGTEWPDYEAVFTRVTVDEAPLRTLRERISPADPSMKE